MVLALISKACKEQMTSLLQAELITAATIRAVRACGGQDRRVHGKKKVQKSTQAHGKNFINVVQRERERETERVKEK